MLPPGQRFGIGMAGFILFLALSTLLLSTARDQLIAEGGFFSATPAAAENTIEKNEIQPFLQRIERVTEIANSCFFEEGLSTHYFITNYSNPRTVGSLTYDYLYREVWVPDEFNVASILTRLRDELGKKVQSATVEQVNLDAKTVRLMVKVDGINTHRFLFTKATKEAPDGAKVLLSYVPDDQRKIDIDAIPTVKYQGAPRVAIIIDDIGYREAVDRLFFQLPGQVTFSVLPFSPSGRKMAEEAHTRGHDVMLHMPMEPISYPENDPGRGKLLVSMSDNEIGNQVEINLQQVPYIVGINNHMGSAFTADTAKMRAALEPLKKHNLFFVDSVTINRSVAYQIAKQKGLPSAARNLFLDHSPDFESICRQMDLAARIARAQGSAIAIGHPFENTFKAIQARMKPLMDAGVEFVKVSVLVR